MREKRIVFAVAVMLLCALMLAACGSNGNKKEKKTEGTPTEYHGVTVTPELTGTPAPTGAEITDAATPTPTATPAPTVALPEGFPENVPLNIVSKYTAEELRKKAEEQVKAPEEYRYKVTTEYEVPKKEEYYSYNLGEVDFGFDKEETFYDDIYDPEKPCLRIQRLNGEIVYTIFQSETLTLIEYDGKQYINLHFSENDTDGKEYTYTFSNPYKENHETLEQSIVCTWTNEAGTTYGATYDSSGSLSELRVTECDTEGRVTKKVLYQYDTYPDPAYYIQEKYVWVYGADGNLIHEEQFRKSEFENTSDYTYEKDEKGRVCAYVETYCNKGGSPAEYRTEILYPTEDTILYLNRYITTYGDESKKEEARGSLYYLGEAERELIKNGFCFVDTMDFNDRGDCKLLSNGKVDLSVTDKLVYSFPWFEYEYKNGHLVKARAYVSGPGSENADYEYDSAGRLIRKHEYSDIIGDRIFSYSYDSNGRLVREEITETACYIMDYWETDDRAMNVTELTVYSYYDNGMLAKKERTVTYRKDSSATEYRREVETYDTDGFPIQIEKQYLNGDVIRMEKSVGERIR